MTIGSENFGSRPAKTEDRFAAQLGGYRSNSRRDIASPLPGDASTDELSPRNGAGIDRVTMPLTTSSMTGSSMAGSALGGGGVGRDGLDAAPIGSSLSTPKLAEPSLSDLGSLSEPMFGRDAWLDAPSGSLADHPLLRGLLLELPPKGTIPQQDWLDRWFEAARSILELLYSQEARN